MEHGNTVMEISATLMWILGGAGTVITGLFGYYLSTMDRRINEKIDSLLKRSEDERVTVAEIKKDVGHLLTEMMDTRKIALKNLDRITQAEKDIIILKGDIQGLVKQYQQ